jgi:hypothetical protein
VCFRFLNYYYSIKICVEHEEVLFTSLSLSRLPFNEVLLITIQLPEIRDATVVKEQYNEMFFPQIRSAAKEEK